MDPGPIANPALPTAESRFLIRNAALAGSGPSDLRIADGRVTAIERQLEPKPGERLIDACGGALIHGLHDHHLHLFATAAAQQSVVCGPPQVRNEQQLEAALLARATTAGQWLRGVGFHDSVSPRLDRNWLDEVCPAPAVRIQHRSGMMWVLNSRALAALGIERHQQLPDGVERGAEGELTGRIFALDAWLRERIQAPFPGLRHLSAGLARCGVTGITDAGARNGPAEWAAFVAARSRGELLQRLLVMGNEELPTRVAEATAWQRVGPLKIYLRETQLPGLAMLERRIASTHRQGRNVAFHCVTRTELVYALAALRGAGARNGDRVEHAAIADDHALEAMTELGVTVVTQPHFIAERGAQYLADVDPGDHELLYRCAGFLRHGVPLAAGSDAPYGALDPWAAMRAAVSRRTAEGVHIGCEEALTPEQALKLYTGDPLLPGRPRAPITVGDPADLCLLDAPWEVVREDLDSGHVAATFCAGRALFVTPALASAPGQLRSR